MKFLLWTAGILLLLVFIASAFNRDTTPEDPMISRKYNAIAMAEQFMTDRLKSPATAKYDPHPDAEDMGNNLWQVSSYVDSQNSFGATLRMKFTATMKYLSDNGDKTQWQLVSLTKTEQ